MCYLVLEIYTLHRQCAVYSVSATNPRYISTLDIIHIERTGALFARTESTTTIPAAPTPDLTTSRIREMCGLAQTRYIVCQGGPSKFIENGNLSGDYAGWAPLRLTRLFCVLSLETCWFFSQFLLFPSDTIN